MKRFAVIFTVFLAAASFAQDLPQIAVYVTGGSAHGDTKKALGAGMLAAFVGSGRFAGAEHADSFVAALESERLKRPGGIANDSLVSEVASWFYVKYVCAVTAAQTGGELQIAARIVNVNEAVTVVSDESAAPLRTMGDIAEAADRTVKALLAKRAAARAQEAGAAQAASAEEPKNPAVNGEPKAAVTVAPPAVNEAPKAAVIAANSAEPDAFDGFLEPAAPRAEITAPIPEQPPVRPEIPATAAEQPPAHEETPKIAVYLAGGRDDGYNKALAGFILEALIMSGKYEAVERSDEFTAQIDREMARQMSGTVDDGQIRKIGMQSGVQFVCVTDLSQTFGTFLLSARIIDVESAKVIATGSSESKLGTVSEVKGAAFEIVGKMLGIDALVREGREMSAAFAAAPEHVSRLSAGVRFGAGNALGMDAWLTQKIGTRGRLNLAVGYRQYDYSFLYEIEDDGSEDIDYKYYNGFEMDCFYGWHTNGRMFRFYAGAGLAVFAYEASYYDEPKKDNSRGPAYTELKASVGVGGHAGIEVLFGKMLLGLDARPVYYVPLMNDCVIIESELRFTAGISVGYTF